MHRQSGGPSRYGTSPVRTLWWSSSGLRKPSYTQSFAVVQRVRDGLVVEADYYLDRSAALKAVGLAG